MLSSYYSYLRFTNVYVTIMLHYIFVYVVFKHVIKRIFEYIVLILFFVVQYRNENQACTQLHRLLGSYENQK